MITFVCSGPTSVRNLAGEAKLFSIILTWDVPVPLNGIIHNYTIRYSVGNNRTLTQSVDTMFTISNLRPSTEVYNITVWARTGGGDGPAEVQPTITTLKSPGVLFTSLKFFHGSYVMKKHYYFLKLYSHVAF